MAIITYPLNNIEYTAEDAEIYLCTRTSGVYSAENNLKPSLKQTNSGYVVTISQGIAWINDGKFKGKCVCNTEEVTLDVPAVEGSDNRRFDYVVLRFDAIENRSYFLIQQAPAAVVDPESVYRPKRDGTYYDLCLARYTVSVVPDLTSFRDMRLDTNFCGLMRDGVTGIPTEQLATQANALLDDIRKQLENIQGDMSWLNKVVYDPQNKLSQVMTVKDFREESGVVALNSNISTYKIQNADGSNGSFKYIRYGKIVSISFAVRASGGPCSAKAKLPFTPIENSFREPIYGTSQVFSFVDIVDGNVSIYIPDYRRTYHGHFSYLTND